MAAKRHERTRARRAALALLYTSEITDEYATTIAEEGRFLAEEGPLSDYGESLVRGVEAHRAAIDNHLIATSENWALTRMPIVDRSILRLATYEMMYVDDVPTSVTINEAVELAKDYGGEDESPRFVNGVLGRIAKMLDGEGEEKAPEAHAAAEAKAPAEEPAAAEAPAATSEPTAEAEAPAPEAEAAASAPAAATPEPAPAADVPEALTAEAAEEAHGGA